MPAQGKQAFADLMVRPDEGIDLALAALLIAQEEYPDLDVEPYLSQVDDLAQGLRGRLPENAGGREAAQTLASYLAGEEGFRGDVEDYYDPRNSFLNDVLVRRRGIPITLSIIYIETGRRAGLQMAGIGFPMHFLTSCAGPSGQAVFLDPFNSGRILSIAECRDLFEQVAGPEATFDSSFLDPTPTRAIVARMLNNLKRTYVQGRLYRKAVGIIDRLLMADPGDWTQVRDRGLMYSELRQADLARRDLATYLDHCSDPAEIAAIRRLIGNLERLLASMED